MYRWTSHVTRVRTAGPLRWRIKSRPGDPLLLTPALNPLGLCKTFLAHQNYVTPEVSASREPPSTDKLTRHLRRLATRIHGPKWQLQQCEDRHAGCRLVMPHFRPCHRFVREGRQHRECQRSTCLRALSHQVKGALPLRAQPHCRKLLTVKPPHRRQAWAVQRPCLLVMSSTPERRPSRSQRRHDHLPRSHCPNRDHHPITPLQRRQGRRVQRPCLYSMSSMVQLSLSKSRRCHSRQEPPGRAQDRLFMRRQTPKSLTALPLLILAGTQGAHSIRDQMKFAPTADNQLTLCGLRECKFSR